MTLQVAPNPITSSWNLISSGLCPLPSASALQNPARDGTSQNGVFRPTDKPTEPPRMEKSIPSLHLCPQQRQGAEGRRRARQDAGQRFQDGATPLGVYSSPTSAPMGPTVRIKSPGQRLSGPSNPSPCGCRLQISSLRGNRRREKRDVSQTLVTVYSSKQNIKGNPITATCMLPSPG